ncbi:MAG: hypothetical protein QOI34_211 [Verrucomicrobiota bacterium]
MVIDDRIRIVRHKNGGRRGSPLGRLRLRMGAGDGT